MQYTLHIEDRAVEYSIRLSKRAKRKQIQITEGRRVVVVLPERRGYRHPKRHAEDLLAEKWEWVTDKLDTQEQYPWSGTREEYLKYRDVAREQIQARLKYFNTQYHFSYGRVSVRNQSSRWGSCSSAGNLSFNYRMIFLPQPLFDYVIVHELCHLKELNHSSRFWNLVAQAIDNPKELAAALP